MKRITYVVKQITVAANNLCGQAIKANEMADLTFGIKGVGKHMSSE